MSREIITNEEELGGYTVEVNVAKEGQAVRSVITELKEIIKEKNLNCLSAPQIGVNMRVFVINFNGDLQSFVNPIFVPSNDSLVFEYIETCPCLPNRRFIRPRYNDIEIIYSTPLGVPKQSRLVGPSAVAYQYCVDHLNGLLLSDVALEIDENYDNATEEERIEFVKRVLNHEKSKSALCREYDISRPTGDKWIKRYLNGEPMGDKSRRPFHTANKISTEDEQRIINARKKEPALGAYKTRKILVTAGWNDAPSISTFNAVFKRNGLITKEASEAAKHIVRFEKEYANEMWQMDFKGNFLMQNGVRCHPLSIMDDYSRFCLCGDAKMNEQLWGVKESLIMTFIEY